jgi:hypothetical protein
MLERLFVQMKPVPVRRCHAGFEDVVKRPEAPAGVVEDAVEDDPDVPGMGRVDELAERLVATEERVDREVVVRVIAVVRRGLEDRRQVDRVGAERGDVVEVLHDAEQVAALEPVEGRWRIPWLHRARLRNAVARREAIREDLVEDRIADPGRRVDGHGRDRRMRGPRSRGAGARHEPEAGVRRARRPGCRIGP